MSHVSAVCSAPIVAEVRARGLDVGTLVDGLGLGLSTFEEPKGRVPWRAFVPFASRAEKMLGADRLEALAAEATVSSAPPSIRRVLPRLMDSRMLFVLAARWWGPWVFNGTHGTCETLPDGRLREIVKIRPEFEACPEFLSGLQGTLRAMPRLTNQPDALVELEQDGREGEFLITPPPRSAGLRDRLLGRVRPGGLGRAARRRLAATEREIEEFEFAREELVATRRQLHLVTAELETRKRHDKTFDDLGRLLAGQSADDPEAFQRSVVELLIRRDEIVGARIVRHGTDSEPERVSAGGRRMGLPDRDMALRIGDREIGQLALWATLEGDDLNQMVPLEHWLAFAIEYGHVRALNAQLTRLLSEDVLDWRDMEKRLERLAGQLTGTRDGRP